MKKILSVMVLMLLSVFLFSGTWSESVNRAFTIQGAYGDVVKVKFTKIPTQSTAFAIGMPFDIESELVQYNITEEGREISYWSVISNSNFELHVTAGKLTSVSTFTDSEKKYSTTGGDINTELDYIMKFKYSIGYVGSDGSQQTATGYFKINTGNGTATVAKPGGGEVTNTETTVYKQNANGKYLDKEDHELSDDDYANRVVTGKYYLVDVMPDSSSLKSGSTIGSVNGSVYFMFTSASTDRIKNDPTSVATGNYTADVTITVVKK